MLFNVRLKQLRELAGLSQAELARRLGIGRDLYNKYERAGIQPSYDTLVLIAKTLNTSIDYLLGNSNVNPDPLTTEEFLAQQGVTNPEHIAMLLSMMDLVKKDSESDSSVGEYLEKDMNMKQAN